MCRPSVVVVLAGAGAAAECLALGNVVATVAAVAAIVADVTAAPINHGWAALGDRDVAPSD